jgi:hypothetical protein
LKLIWTQLGLQCLHPSSNPLSNILSVIYIHTKRVICNVHCSCICLKDREKLNICSSLQFKTHFLHEARNQTRRHCRAWHRQDLASLIMHLFSAIDYMDSAFCMNTKFSYSDRTVIHNHILF